MQKNEKDAVSAEQFCGEKLTNTCKATDAFVSLHTQDCTIQLKKPHMGLSSSQISCIPLHHQVFFQVLKSDPVLTNSSTRFSAQSSCNLNLLPIVDQTRYRQALSKETLLQTLCQSSCNHLSNRFSKRQAVTGSSINRAGTHFSRTFLTMVSSVELQSASLRKLRIPTNCSITRTTTVFCSRPDSQL